MNHRNDIKQTALTKHHDINSINSSTCFHTIIDWWFNGTFGQIHSIGFEFGFFKRIKVLCDHNLDIVNYVSAWCPISLANWPIPSDTLQSIHLSHQDEYKVAVSFKYSNTNDLNKLYFNQLRAFHFQCHLHSIIHRCSVWIPSTVFDANESSAVFPFRNIFDEILYFQEVVARNRIVCFWKRSTVDTFKSSGRK